MNYGKLTIERFIYKLCVYNIMETMKYEDYKIRRRELNMLKNESFINRLKNYDDEEIMRICTAWQDTDKENHEDTWGDDNDSFSPEFEDICIAIMKGMKGE